MKIPIPKSDEKFSVSICGEDKQAGKAFPKARGEVKLF
jgi:hypothetical protein